MFENAFQTFAGLVGDDGVSTHLSIGQITLRTTVVFVIALSLLRVGKRRFMGKHSTFDILVALIVGTTMARAIIGQVTLIDMTVIVALLMILHWIVSTATFYSPLIQNLIEKRPRKLVTDGELDWGALRKSKISDGDVMQALREEAHSDKLGDVRSAFLEHDGHISVVLGGRELGVVEAGIEKGVKAIRLVVEKG